jgi:hypothetical protein
MENLDDVHVDLPQLGRLAVRLDDTGRRLSELADRLLVHGSGAGLGSGPRRRLREVGAWADHQHHTLRDLLAQLRRLEAAGALPLGLTVSRRRHRAFADPVAAHAAAAEVTALLEAGSGPELRRAGALMAEHVGDPVFAATLLHGAGPGGVAAVLHRAHRRWAQNEAVDRSLVNGLAAALAAAMRADVSPFGWRQLALASSRRPTGSRALALLFTAPAIFPAAALVGAVRHLVVPWNRTTVRHPGTGPTVWGLVGSRGGIDLRTTVLRRVAADPAAARTVVATTSLDDLAAAGVGYGDGGLAVAEVLVAGTAPVDPAPGRLVAEPLITGQRPVHPVTATNLAKVVDWMSRSRSVPVGVEMSVGRLVGPWIGSVRSGGLDGGVVRHAPLDEDAARRVLGSGMRFGGVRDRLRQAAWSWAGREARRMAARSVSGAGFDALGSVVGIVSVEAQNARARAATGQDLERDRQRSLWSFVQGLAAKPLPGALRTVVGTVGGPVRDRLLPDADLELVHWREHRDRDIGHDALAFEYLVATTLWDHREANGYFDTVGGRPPASLTVDHGHGPELRPLVGLGQDAVADYLAWRSRLADGRPAPIQLAVERFVSEGREASPG